ncbi:hypothetical protein LTR56_023751 [Elasticomyces elasticus]|nr:hypothetical protein LTR56_023751 [Elasticomyces elasticus]KAK3662379.1 hypothetical protein LTR22_006912 [Elasticomyces elasticus]KAK4912450.1 hypothetical protein LTR49_019064 [Elasticomyces elasticus]KAK5766912.1 hypothetical protein LTS12_002988 [Elasticomyces elasticus]
MSDAGDDEQKRTANLARIRDNQRRSRARRKEYLSEIEAKYRTCEQTGAEASAEIQQAARRVLEENKRLRELLKHQGLSDTEIDKFLYERPENPQYPSATTVALENMIGQRRPCGPGSTCSTSSSIQDAVQVSSGSSAQQCHAPYPRNITSPPSTASSAFQHHPAQSYDAGSVVDVPDGHRMNYDDPFIWNEQYAMPNIPVSTETSSCYVAADAIRSIKPDVGYSLEMELGCGDGRECHVPNTQIFSIMDRYSSGPIG